MSEAGARGNPAGGPKRGEPSPPPDEIRLDCERYRLLVENSLDLIIEVSPELNILYVSPNVKNLLGYGPAELAGSCVFDRIHPDDVDDIASRFAQRAGTGTCRYRHRDGSWRWLEGGGRAFLTPDGAEHRVLVVRDVTAQREAAAERDRLSAELARAERLTALGIVAGGMAHDFNNLLSSIIGFASLAQLAPDRFDHREALEQIYSAGQRAKRIVQQVLEFDRPQSLPRSPVRLGAIAGEVIALLRPTLPPTAELRLQAATSADLVSGNATQLHQLILNLCQNAVHALESGRGRVDVTIESVSWDAPPPEAAPLKPGRHVRLSVTDNGHGMDEETRRRIFEPFFTTKTGGRGSGLGLAVVQRVVRDHAGAIEVISAPGKGAVFRVTLPAHAPALPPGAA